MLQTVKACKLFFLDKKKVTKKIKAATAKGESLNARLKSKNSL